jgi:hypothetical protein
MRWAARDLERAKRSDKRPLISVRFVGRDRKSIVLLEGSQASPSRPSGKGQCESKDVRMVRSGLRQGLRDSDFLK